MRRSNFLIQLISAIVFLAMAVYIGYYIYNANANPMQTAPAVPYSLERAVETTGRAVRSETVIPGGGGNVAVIKREGEKVSAGEAVAVEYLTDTALQRAGERMRLNLRIDQVKALLSGGTMTQAESAAALDIAYAARCGDMAALDSAILALESAAVKSASHTSDDLKDELRSLESQLAAIEINESDTVYVRTDAPGIFSAAVDGYEHITPEMIRGMGVSEYESLFNSPEEKVYSPLGKLIDNISWYYVTVMEHEDARRLTVGDRATLRFSKTYSGIVSMKVERIGENENGRCLVVFSGTKYLSDITTVRDMTADVIFGTVEGIYTAKSAVRLDENGKTYLYIRVGIQARKIYIEILGETGDYYIVKSITEGELRQGAEIIVRARGLYDGKVI